MPNTNQDIIKKLNNIKNLIEKEDFEEAVQNIETLIFEIEDGGFDMFSPWDED